MANNDNAQPMQTPTPDPALKRLEKLNPSTQAFSSTVYSNMAGVPVPYQWDIQGNIVTHWTDGSKYTGTFSEDGTILSGGWRPEEGKEGPENAAYDATMVRVEDRK